MRNKLALLKPEQNITDPERIVSALGGLYLVYDSLKRKRSVPEIAAAGFMLFRGISGYCPITGMVKKSEKQQYKPHNINIHTRLLINSPVNEVYSFWRNFGNLPLFMEHLEEVTVFSDTLSEWKAKIPGGLGATISWKAEIINEEPYRFISWESLPGSVVKTVGRVNFKDAGELGTLIHIIVSYKPTRGGAVAEGAAALFTPLFEKILRRDIEGFKRFMETGNPDKIQENPVQIYT